jgi:hypothetical protein
VYVIAPLLADVGGVRVGAFEPRVTEAELSLKPDKVGVALVIDKLVVAVALE